MWSAQKWSHVTISLCKSIKVTQSKTWSYYGNTEQNLLRVQEIYPSNLVKYNLLLKWQLHAPKAKIWQHSHTSTCSLHIFGFKALLLSADLYYSAVSTCRQVHVFSCYSRQWDLGGDLWWQIWVLSLKLFHIYSFLPFVVNRSIATTCSHGSSVIMLTELSNTYALHSNTGYAEIFPK